MSNKNFKTGFFTGLMAAAVLFAATTFVTSLASEPTPSEKHQEQMQRIQEQNEVLDAVEALQARMKKAQEETKQLKEGN